MELTTQVMSKLGWARLITAYTRYLNSPLSASASRYIELPWLQRSPCVPVAVSSKL